MLLQSLCMLGTTAQAQEWHFGEPFEQQIQTIEMSQQGCCRLCTHARHARDIVNGIAGQAQEIGDLVRIGSRLSAVPETFHVHKTVKRFMDNRLSAVESGQSWASLHRFGTIRV